MVGTVLIPVVFVLFIRGLHQLVPRLVPAGPFGVTLWIWLTFGLFITGIQAADDYFEARSASFPPDGLLLLNAWDVASSELVPLALSGVVMAALAKLLWTWMERAGEEQKTNGFSRATIISVMVACLLIIAPLGWVLNRTGWAQNILFGEMATSSNHEITPLDLVDPNYPFRFTGFLTQVQKVLVWLGENPDWVAAGTAVIAAIYTIVTLMHRRQEPDQVNRSVLREAAPEEEDELPLPRRYTVRRTPDPPAFLDEPYRWEPDDDSDLLLPRKPPRN